MSECKAISFQETVSCTIHNDVSLQHLTSAYYTPTSTSIFLMQPDSFAGYHISCGFKEERVSKNKLLFAHFNFCISDLRIVSCENV